MKTGRDARDALQRVRAGGGAKYREKAGQQGKLFCRERLALLLDADSFVEDAALANWLAGDLPADGVVTGSGRIDGRPVCVMANDSTVKAGSMCGPGFEPDACLALPSAMIAVMGPEAAVNAVYFNKLEAIADPAARADEVEKLRAEFREDVDIGRLASELVVDAVVDPAELRRELVVRFAAARGRRDVPPRKRRSVLPV